MLWMDNEESAYREYIEAVQRKKRKTCLGRFNGGNARAVCESCFGDGTPDGVSFSSSRIRWGKIAESMRESA